MKHKKTFCVLGLGIFGSTLAKKIHSHNFEVIAIDRDMACVDRLKEDVNVCIKADFTDIEQLRSIGVQDCDVAIVATGSLLEESVLGVMNLKELGVPYVLAKAKNKTFMHILYKVGADKVVRPEKEMGEKLANTLISENIIDLIEIDKEYSIIEIKAYKDWINKSLLELDLRNNHGINVLGIRKKPNEHLSISPSANYIIEDSDILLIIAENSMFTKLSELF